MKQIFNYKISLHFYKRMNERKVEPFLISLCLSKGVKTKQNKQKKKQIKFTLYQEKILEAIDLGYISIENYLSLESIIVITEANRLVTTYCRYSDTGLA